MKRALEPASRLNSRDTSSPFQESSGGSNSTYRSSPWEIPVQPNSVPPLQYQGTFTGLYPTSSCGICYFSSTLKGHDPHQV